MAGPVWRGHNGPDPLPLCLNVEAVVMSTVVLWVVVAQLAMLVGYLLGRRS